MNVPLLFLIAGSLFSFSAHAVMTPEECLKKYSKLMDRETNEDRLYKLDEEFIKCKKNGEKVANRLPYIGDGNSGAPQRNFPAAGYSEGLAGFLKEHQLVVTHSESSCPSEKRGLCRATAYITRVKFPKHRPGDTGAFCGAMASWERSENGKGRWAPSNGLASSLAQGETQAALMTIDEKNRLYCK